MATIPNTVVAVVITAAVAVAAVSGWVIYQRMNADQPEAAVVSVQPPAAAAEQGVQVNQETARLAQERDEALAEAARVRARLAAERAQQSTSLVGEWSGAVPGRGAGPYGWVFHRDGTFTESDGDYGTWTQNGARIEWVYAHGIVYTGRMDGDVLTGARYVNGQHTSTFRLRRTTQ